MVLAQSGVGATELGQWLLVAAAAAVIANQGTTCFKNLIAGLQKKHTPRSEGMPDMAFCDERHHDIDGRITGLDRILSSKLDAMRTEMKSDLKGVHSRVDDVMKGVARIEGKIL